MNSARSARSSSECCPTDAAMIGLIMIVTVVIIFLFAPRYVISGAFTGSVKG